MRNRLVQIVVMEILEYLQTGGRIGGAQEEVNEQFNEIKALFDEAMTIANKYEKQAFKLTHEGLRLPVPDVLI